jgi:GNAT superfamily N-acetyltransferase|tara:strand:- start:209 stop:823 length:615 start_codon:yes stop_codon:yes gene_type:complete
MNFREFSVDNLESSHLNEITNIWIESLPYNIKSIIGKKIIQKYLEKFFKTEGNVGIGLFKSSKLIGFVFFGNDNKIISQIFKENLIYILFSFFLYFIKFKFIRVFYYLDVLIYLILSKFNKKNYRNTTELLIISIKKNYQNKGFGSYLLKASFEKNKDYLKKFDHLIVMTLKSTPENINFYEKNNFKIFYKIYGRVYLRLNLLR